MIKTIDNLLHKSALYVVIAAVMTMLTLAVLNIVLRQFGITYLWIDPLVRHLVFSATFLGGVIAVGENQHIKIDIISRLLEKSDNHLLKNSIQVIVLIATAVACAVLIYSSYNLVLLEMESDSEVFLGIHSSHLIGIITVGMGLIFLRLFTQLLLLISGAND